MTFNGVVVQLTVATAHVLDRRGCACMQQVRHGPTCRLEMYHAGKNHARTYVRFQSLDTVRAAAALELTRLLAGSLACFLVLDGPSSDI
jgi:hypothetical protein